MEKEKLIQYFSEHREEMIEDICYLVAIDSSKSGPLPGKPYGEGPAMALDAAMELAGRYGFTVTDYDHRMATADLNDLPPRLDMLAHVDVVPGGESWTVTTPFSPVVRDGRIYGRGSSDDKGPAVAALYAMRAVKDLGIPLKGNIRLILGSDEESGMSDKQYYYSRQKPAEMTFSPDGYFPVINTEKGKIGGTFSAEWDKEDFLPRIVSIDCGGTNTVVPGAAEAVILGISAEEIRYRTETVSTQTKINFSIEETGQSIHITGTGIGGHAAEPVGTNNALTGLLELLCCLPFADSEAMRRVRALHKMFPHGDLSGTGIGIAMKNDISGDLAIMPLALHLKETGLTGRLDIRIPLQATDANTINVLLLYMDERGMKADFTFRPAHHVPETSELVQTLQHCYEMYSGRQEKPAAMSGSTYVHGLPGGVAFGCVLPGVDTHMHGPDEFMDIDTLLMSAAIFAQAIIELCGA